MDCFWSGQILYKKKQTGSLGCQTFLSNGTILRTARLFQNLDSERVPLSEVERADLEKKYPYYGASGQIDFVDRYIFDEDHILVGEDGAT